MASNNPAVKARNNLHFSNKNIRISPSTMAITPDIKIIKNINAVLMMNAELRFKKEKGEATKAKAKAKAKAMTKNKKAKRATAKTEKGTTFFEPKAPNKSPSPPATFLETQPEDVAIYQPWDDIILGPQEPNVLYRLYDDGLRPEDSCMGCLLSTCQRASYVATAVGVANSMEGPATKIMNNPNRHNWFISIYNGVKKVYTDATYGTQCARMYAVKTWPTS